MTYEFERGITQPIIISDMSKRRNLLFNSFLLYHKPKIGGPSLFPPHCTVMIHYDLCGAFSREVLPILDPRPPKCLIGVSDGNEVCIAFFILKRII